MKILALNIVLVGTDLTDGSLAAIGAAHTVARAAGALLHVVHVGDDGAGGEGVHAQLAQLGIRLDEASVHTLPGEPAAGVVRLAAEIGADTIIVGPHRKRRQEQSGAETSTALAIATHALVPVLVVGHEARIPMNHVVVAVDGSETARGALVVSLAWASALRESRVSPAGTTLTALHVDESPAGPERHAVLSQEVERRVAKLRDDAGTWAGVEIDHAVVEGKNVPQAIIDYADAHDADLIVLGTRGVGLDRERRLGSVSAAVCGGVMKPVLLVPPAVWQSYIQADTLADRPVESA